MRQDGDDTQLTVLTGLLHHVFIQDLTQERFVSTTTDGPPLGFISFVWVFFYLQEFGSRGVVGEQIQSPLDDVGAGAASLVVFGLLPFAEDLDGGEPSDLHAEGAKANSDEPGGLIKWNHFNRTSWMAFLFSF